MKSKNQDVKVNNFSSEFEKHTSHLKGIIKQLNVSQDIQKNIDFRIEKIIDIFNSTKVPRKDESDGRGKPFKISIYNLEDEKLRLFWAPKRPDNIKIDSVNICTKLTLKVSSGGYEQIKTIHLSGDKKKKDLIFKDEKGKKIRHQ